MPERKIAPPPLNPESAPFYKAAADSRFMTRKCTVCGQLHWYPRAICPFCWGPTEWLEIERTGTVYSYSVMRRVDPPFAIAYVTLDAGPTMLTNLVDCDFDALSIGQRVTMVFKPTDGGAPVPCFTPLQAGR